MLVSHHGRIIPLQRFKVLAIIIALMFALAGAALSTLGFLYVHQTRINHDLGAELAQMSEQIAKLRDENDVLRVKKVINQVHSTDPRSDPTKKSDSVKSPKIKQKAAEQPRKVTIPKKAPELSKIVQPDVDQIVLRVAIKSFQVTYNVHTKILMAQFRIYNETTPRIAVAGRTVVVFKNHDDPPIKWISVPSIPLINGKPKGNQGQAFKIRNYHTQKFKSFGQTPPIRFDMASVYVFSAKGDLLLNRDFAFKVPYQALKPSPVPNTSPPLPPTDVMPEPAQKPVTDKTRTPAVLKPIQESKPKEGAKTETQTQDTTPAQAQPAVEDQPQESATENDGNQDLPTTHMDTSSETLQSSDDNTSIVEHDELVNE